jgi:NADPH2:quinone reductase
MNHAIVVRELGSADVLHWEPYEVGPPEAGQVQVRQTAIGLNYIDVYDRTGLYPRPLPFVPGREAAGVVQAVGRSVRDLKVGQRVAYVHSQAGTYTQIRNVTADEVVRIPAGIQDEQAAAMMLKGLTAQFLLRRTFRVQADQWLLVHAAAGGVGLILCQWAKALGARVIGVVGHENKVALARRNGCRHVLLTGKDPLVESVRKLTRGAMADVVYDSVGRDTFMDSLDCLKRRGMMVSFGNASGPPPPIAPGELAKRGSLYLTRPTLFNYIATRPELVSAARELFAVVKSGAVRVRIGQRYQLADAAQAHRDLEARRTTGSTVLLP